MGFPAWTKLSAAIWPTTAVDTDKADVRKFGLELETAINSLFNNSGIRIINGVITPSVAANVLTIAIKTAAGADPSATDPVYVLVRSSTLASGAWSIITLTAATSFVASAGSTFGGVAAVPLTLLFVGFNDAGIFRPGVINPFASGVLYPIPSTGIASSTAEGGAGAADSAGVFYTGTAVSSKPFVILGVLKWTSNPLATAGSYATAPDETQNYRADLKLPGDYPQGYLYGLTLSNDVSDANNDIDIAAGIATADHNLGLLALTSTLVKRSDASWAVGSGNGGMDTGSKTTSQWLYVWLIGRSDTGVVDALFSASATAPTMPTGYDQKRRIGTVLTDGSSNIVAFVQTGDEFIFAVPNNLTSGTNPGTSAVLRAVYAPPIAGMTAIIVYWVNNVTTAAVQVLITDPAQVDTTPTTVLFDMRFTATGQAQSVTKRVKHNGASAQVRFRHQASGASDAYNLTSLGWVDPRGRISA